MWVSRSDVMTPREAVAFYSEQIATQPQHDLLHRRAKAYELLSDWDAAIKDYDELIRLSPQSSAYWNNRANYYSRKRDYDNALAGYNEAIKLSPTSFIPLGQPREHSTSTCASGTRRSSRTTDAIKVNPTYARAYGGRSAAWREKREYDKALADAETGVELEPLPAHVSGPRTGARGPRRTTTGHSPTSTNRFASTPCSRPRTTVGLAVHLARKAYQPAIRDLDTAMRLSPKYAAAMVRRAEVWVACGNPRRALADLDEAIAADERYGPAHRQKAWLLATYPVTAIRNGKTAVDVARRALDLTQRRGRRDVGNAGCRPGRVGRLHRALSSGRRRRLATRST